MRRAARSCVALSLALSTTFSAALTVWARTSNEQKASGAIGAIPDVHGLGTSGPGSVSASSTTQPTNSAPGAAAVAQPTNSAPGAAAASQPTNSAPGAAAASQSTNSAPGAAAVAQPTNSVPGAATVAQPTNSVPGAATVAQPTNSAPGATVSPDSNSGQSSAALGAIPDAAPSAHSIGAALGAIPEPSIPDSAKLLKATISADGKKSPLLFGSLQYIPKGANIDITLMGNLNSEVSQKGDEVWVRVAQDVQGSSGVGVPGGWFMHGLVTDSVGQKRLGRNGYVSVEFDSLVSPDGEDVLPFHAGISTKDSMMVSAIKEIGIDSGYVGYGAAGGAILSVQLTGIGVAVASHGYSVAIGAGVGAVVGAIGAAKRKGKIASLYPGDDMQIVTAEPISLPAFDKALLPSAQPHPHLANMQITINKAFFSKDPMGDRSSHLLTVDFTVNNKTHLDFNFMDLAVVSDHQQRYTPSLSEIQALHKTVKPDTRDNGVITFAVDSNKRKYWLVLTDRTENSELTRVPIN